MIISLSGKKRSGKTTVANYLISKHNFKEVSWAEPLKEVIGRKLFGLTEDQLYGPASIREEVIEKWGMSPRKILQVVGTDLFRAWRDDFWVEVAEPKIKALVTQGEDVVISDTRFLNEVECVKRLGGHTIQVHKVKKEGKAQPEDSHASETALDEYEFDYAIQSFSGDLDTLYEKMENILNDLKGGSNAFSEGK